MSCLDQEKENLLNEDNQSPRSLDETISLLSIRKRFLSIKNKSFGKILVINYTNKLSL